MQVQQPHQSWIKGQITVYLQENRIVISSDNMDAISFKPELLTPNEPEQKFKNIDTAGQSVHQYKCSKVVGCQKISL